MTLPMRVRRSSRSPWAAAAVASFALTWADSSLVRASRARFSSPWAWATPRPRDFCSARRVSNAVSELPSELVGGEDGVDERLVVAAGALRGADEGGVVAEQPDVDHDR